MFDYLKWSTDTLVSSHHTHITSVGLLCFNGHVHGGGNSSVFFLATQAFQAFPGGFSTLIHFVTAYLLFFCPESRPGIDTKYIYKQYRYYI